MLYLKANGCCYAPGVSDEDIQRLALAEKRLGSLLDRGQALIIHLD